MMTNNCNFISGLVVLSVFFFSGCASEELPEPEEKPTAEEKTTVREMIAHKTKEAIVIDGKLNEAAWDKATVVDNFYTWINGKKKLADHQTEVRILWDDDFLYIGAKMEDKDVYAKQTDKSRSIEDDVFEVFIKPFVDEKHYYEFHVTPKNLQRELFWRNKSEMTPDDALYEGGINSATQIIGVLNDWEVEDEGWTVELAIPFTALRETTPPPEPGTIWRVAFCRYNYSYYLPESYPRPAQRLPEDSKRARELSSSAALPKPNFHITEKYDQLLFVDNN